MTRRHMLLSRLAIAAALVAQASAVHAGETDTPQTADGTGRSAPVAMATHGTPTETGPRQVRPLGAGDLSASRGGSTLVVNDQKLTAITSGNAIDGDYEAGEITLGENALSNFNGVGNFLFNTGAQNSLQTGMTLTINIEN